MYFDTPENMTVYLGIGLLSSTGDLKASAVALKDEELDIVEPNEAQRVTKRFEVVESWESIYQQRDASIKGKVTSGVYSASASLSKSSSISINEYSITVYASSIVRLEDRAVHYPKLNALAKKQVKSNPEKFLNRYGDQFVSGVKLGAELTGIITIESASKSVRHDVRASLKASGSGAKMSASLSEMSQKHSGKLIISVKIIRAGGAPVQIGSDMEWRDFIDKVDQFENSVKLENAIPIGYVASSYDTVADIPVEVSDMLDVAILTQESNLTHLARRFLKAQQLYDKVEFAISNRSWFVLSDDQINALYVTKSELDEKIFDILEEAKKVRAIPDTAISQVFTLPSVSLVVQDDPVIVNPPPPPPPPPPSPKWILRLFDQYYLQGNSIGFTEPGIYNIQGAPYNFNDLASSLITENFFPSQYEITLYVHINRKSQILQIKEPTVINDLRDANSLGKYENDPEQPVAADNTISSLEIKKLW